MSAKINFFGNNLHENSVAAMHNFYLERFLSIALLFSVCLLTACESSQVNSTTPASEKTEPDLPALITADELAKLVKSDTKNVKILEPGIDLEVFSEGHLPTAQFLDWVDDMTDPAETEKYNIPTPADFAQVMSRLGIKNSDRVVIYDRLSSRLSTRLFWIFKSFEHDRVQVLDGGFAAGKTKLDVSTKTVSSSPSLYLVHATRDSIIADMNLVQEKVEDLDCRLIDGRPEEQFSGEKAGAIFHTGQAHSRKGHIPGAINVFWKDNFNPDGTFKSTQELRSLYEDAGILSENEVITYCNEGLHAAPPWFVLTQLLGYKNVRLYDSSMAEWAESEQPMQTLPAAK